VAGTRVARLCLGPGAGGALAARVAMAAVGAGAECRFGAPGLGCGGWPSCFTRRGASRCSFFDVEKQRRANQDCEPDEACARRCLLRMVRCQDLSIQLPPRLKIQRNVSDREGDLALVQMALHSFWQRHKTQNEDLLQALCGGARSLRGFGL
jgi:hypothetical protein